MSPAMDRAETNLGPDTPATGRQLFAGDIGESEIIKRDSNSKQEPESVSAEVSLMET